MKKPFTFSSLVIVIFISGCASSKLPEKLTELKMQKIKSTKLPFSVAVEEYKFPVYSESLETNLSNTKIFKEVGQSSQFPTPDLVAKIKNRIYGTECFPILTLLTLGIIPTFVEENHGDSFSLSSPEDPGKKVLITYRYRSTSVLGWLGLFLNLHPDWYIFPEHTQRYFDSLAYEIVIKSESIKALTKKNK